MSEKESKMQLPKLDDLFTTQEQRDYDNTEKVVELNIKDIVDFPNHPFKVIDDEKMNETVESVKKYGVIHAIIVRKNKEGKYEIISGHRRKRACEIARKEKIPCIVKDLSDEEATILMVDSNLQREEILPSEKAFAFKMKLEALKHQGKKLDINNNITSAPMEQKLKEEQTSRQILANESDESREQIRRYIRLTELIPEILEMVDEKRIAFRPAVELSYLSEENQYVLLDLMQFSEATPSLAQAIRMKKLEQECRTISRKVRGDNGTRKAKSKGTNKVWCRKNTKLFSKRVHTNSNGK